MASGAAALLLVGTTPVAAQRPAAATPLVFDGVTVVDVEHGKLLPARRVVISGSRIQTVEETGAGKLPKGAQVVDARGKYLIPGLWDMHVHVRGYNAIGEELTLASLLYPLLVANGVTGIRDAGSRFPLDTLRRWRQEILAGTRVGPPRQILSGPYLEQACGQLLAACVRHPDSAGVRHLVDSLQAAGADMIKLHGISREMYFTAAAEARRLGIPFGGHIPQATSAIEAADSGARIIDHLESEGVSRFCGAETASAEQCRSMTDHLKRHDTWIVVDAFWGDKFDFRQRMRDFWVGSLPGGNWLRGSASTSANSDSTGADHVVQQLLQRIARQHVELPLLAGTDATVFAPWRDVPLGFMLHGLLAEYVADGLTPLAALQAATLNPAKLLHETDSLGTVAPGKLADLVLLDADPLTDITNTTTIRAVVANGRYFDRAALDQLLSEIRAKAKQLP